MKRVREDVTAISMPEEKEERKVERQRKKEGKNERVRCQQSEINEKTQKISELFDALIAVFSNVVATL
jgi:hypothetical protein